MPSGTSGPRRHSARSQKQVGRKFEARAHLQVALVDSPEARIPRAALALEPFHIMDSTIAGGARTRQPFHQLEAPVEGGRPWYPNCSSRLPTDQLHQTLYQCPHSPCRSLNNRWAVNKINVRTGAPKNRSVTQGSCKPISNHEVKETGADTKKRAQMVERPLSSF